MKGLIVNNFLLGLLKEESQLIYTSLSGACKMGLAATYEKLKGRKETFYLSIYYSK